MAETQKSASRDAGKDDAGQAEVQAKFDEAAEQGFFGTVPDETPNENYTVQGVGAGKPTPETTRADRKS